MAGCTTGIRTYSRFEKTRNQGILWRMHLFTTLLKYTLSADEELATKKTDLGAMQTELQAVRASKDLFIRVYFGVAIHPV